MNWPARLFMYPVGAAALLDELNPEWQTHFDPNLPVVSIAGREFKVDKNSNVFTK